MEELQKKYELLENKYEQLEMEKNIIINEKENLEKLYKNSNETDVKLIIDFIKFIFSINENVMKNENTDIIIYGSFFDNYFSKKNLNNTNLLFYFKNINIEKISSIIEVLNDMNYFTNFNHSIKKYFLNKNNNLYEINYWDLKLKINNLIINVTFHDTEFFDTTFFNNQKLVLTKNGFSIRKDEKHKSISLFNIINELMSNKVSMVQHNFNINIDKNEIIKILQKQNDLLKQNFSIKNGYKNATCAKNHCCICFEKYEKQNLFLYKLECSHTLCTNCLFKLTYHRTSTSTSTKCPLCRENINLAYA